MEFPAGMPGGKGVLMNGIRGVSFQEVPGGLIVHAKKSQKTSRKSSAGKLKKRLPYSFKQMSKQIQQAKTADAARPLVARMQAKLNWLYKKLRNGEYGESEIAAAIIHATAMERIAKRKVRHLEEEEAAESGSGEGNPLGQKKDGNGNGSWNLPDKISDEDWNGERNGSEGQALTEKLSVSPYEGNPGNSSKGNCESALDASGEIAEESMKKLMEELENLERELVEESYSELEDLCSSEGKNLTEDEIKDLKRKHRGEEERQLMHADLKYLKALFDRLEQEKKQAASFGSHSEGGHGNVNSDIRQGSMTSNSGRIISCAVECVPEIEMGDIGLGESLDITV